MQIRESAENYLETILILSQRKGKGEVRSIDIVNELEFSKPSVSVAMKNLRENGYITVDKDGYIRLTDKGLEIAEKMYERHTLLSQWLIRESCSRGRLPYGTRYQCGVLCGYQKAHRYGLIR